MGLRNNLLACAHKGIKVAAVPVGEAFGQQLLLLLNLLLAQRLRVIWRWRNLRLYHILRGALLQRNTPALK